ncbi:hypothetical protein [Virgibacillus sp. DJP39]|uniref:hypothetical protein n=1 Tax=Virgibacillus sp. DJP39 TaxID=3409790 RepID=UPI003BB81217
MKHAVKQVATYVTAASSGNYSQAVAYNVNSLGVPATIVIPEDATLSKIKAIKACNLEIEARGTTSAEIIGK